MNYTSLRSEKLVHSLFGGHLQVLDQSTICENIKPVFKGDSCEVIDILIGADVMEEPSEENLAMAVLSLFVNEAKISNLWKLDLIGINDPVEKKSEHEIDLQIKKYFLETVTINAEGL
ncbi:hypothetical protein TNCV_3941721 [Trichonephila clavipes]|uniref:Uncharacterized protein n=1 Tax=Trichonephila clavipes TaxID=2585209 RepID=A0A8X6VW11_TRICX|nr:hypothetical protein TNCV_3941721 [Trichonephila clavipes]